jgi:hypothetical protein
MPQGLLFLGRRASARAFAGTRIGICALPANRQALSMPIAAVAADIHKPLDVSGDFTAEVTFNFMILFEFFTDLVDLVGGKVINAARPINAGHVKDLERGCPADAINIRQCDIRALASGQVNSSDSGHV